MNFFPGYNQYILWRPEIQDGGKIDKIPLGNHLDPRNWYSYGDAQAAARLFRCNVGFVFTANDPLFFVDIDHALTDDIWSPLSQKICAMFPGCAMEISYSGQGVHIFGSGVPTVSHRNKNKEFGLEFYFQDRFVALTWNGATGSALVNGQPGLDRLLPQYFSPKPNTGAAFWTTEPCEGWAGPDDDTELLKIAMRSKSAASVFGGGVSFADLFRADPDKLAERFPSENAAFDWSSADAALALHLAFYTGRNCERIERLFNKSELGNRDKWRDRPDYRQRTILNAAAICRNVYSRPQATRTADAPNESLRAGLQFLDIEAQREHFSGCTYVVSRHRVFTPHYGLLRSDQFRAAYGGYQFALAAEGRPTKNAFEAFTESQLYDFPRANGVCFRPECAAGAIIAEEGHTYVNTYAPAGIEVKPGDPERLQDLLTRLLPQPFDREILLAYMAACAQYPGVKFQWAPLLQGAEGNGKTFLVTSVARAVGERYSHFPNAADLAGNGLKFTGWLFGKLFIGVEEIFAKGKIELQEALKPFITSRKIEIQSKGVDQFTADNRANFFFCTNHKDAVNKTQGDRRYCVLYSAQQTEADIISHGMGGSYFPELYEWAYADGFAIIAGFLKNYKIPDQLNPATNCHRAPRTSSSAEAFALARSDAEQEVWEAVQEQRVGFRGGWVSSIALDRLLTEKRLKVARNKRREMLANLGYEIKERLNSASPMDGGKRPVLYAIKDSELFALEPGVATASAYAAAQQGA